MHVLVCHRGIQRLAYQVFWKRLWLGNARAVNEETHLHLLDETAVCAAQQSIEQSAQGLKVVATKKCQGTVLAFGSVESTFRRTATV